MSRICDHCDRFLLDEQTYHNCTQCGGYDICEQCFSDNQRCHNEQHSLLHLRVRGDAIVDASTGNLVHYSAFKNCPGCSWEKSGKPQEETPFTYELFPDDSFIRVIDLSPGPENQPLRYSLHYARLDSSPVAQYVAISYACGDVNAKVLSYCNGQKLDIYANLDNALRKWRMTPKQNWLRIWADGICINQHDNQEKSAQVARMHEIYRHTNQIFVDLGYPSRGIDLALDLLLRASRGFAESVKVREHPDPSPSGSVYNRRLPTTEVSVEEALALSQFAELAWWKRLWVVQEVCLWDVYTAFPPLLLCGDHTIQWIDLINAASQLGRAPPQVKYDPALVTPELRGAFIEGTSWSPAAVSIFLEYYKIVSKQGPAQNLHWFLQRAWDLQATNPADKVYGLLGLVNDQYDIVHAGMSAGYLRKNGLVEKLAGKREIRVDYNLPVRTVYEEISRLTLQEEQSLDSLADAGSGKSRRSLHLPSWVPDWNGKPSEPALLSRLGSATTSNYQASLETKPIMPESQTSGLLEVDALFVDVVLLEAARYCGETDVVETASNVLLRQRRVINVKEHILSLWWCFGVKYNKYPTGERPFDVFWRTLVANRVTVSDQKVVPQSGFAGSFLMANPEILEVETKDEKPVCICPAWATDMSRELPDINGSGALEEREFLPIRDKFPRPGELFGDKLAPYGEHYNSALHQAAIGRKFFKTSNGYMGIGPRNLTCRDHVVILKGGSLPFLLREADVGHIEGKPVYTLLGEAYVHGLSDGEALRDFEDPDHDSKWTRVILN